MDNFLPVDKSVDNLSQIVSLYLTQSTRKCESDVPTPKPIGADKIPYSIRTAANKTIDTPYVTLYKGLSAGDPAKTGINIMPKRKSKKLFTQAETRRYWAERVATQYGYFSKAEATNYVYLGCRRKDEKTIYYFAHAVTGAAVTVHNRWHNDIA